MTFNTHYEPVPVTEKPEKDGWYTLVANQLIDVVCWYDSEQGWELCGYSRYTTWLRPRPDTVLLTREEVERMIDAMLEVDREKDINNQFKYVS